MPAKPSGGRKLKQSKGKKGQGISLVLLFLLNTALSLLIGRKFFIHGGSAGPAEILQFAAHFLSLNMAVAVLLLPFSIFLRRALKYPAFLLYWLLQVFLFLDSIVYGIFHFHINSLVINMITTEGFSDSVVFGRATVLSFALKAALLFFAELAFIYISIRTAGRLGWKARTAIVAICLLAVAADKVVYALGDMYNVQSITRAMRLYPLYQPLKADRTISRIFGLKVKKEDQLRISAHGGLLDYPRRPLVMGPNRPRQLPNVVIIAVEGFRWDMLSPDITPNLWKFAKSNVNFRHHYSGGNGSRAGVFSLLYGLQGSYWQPVLIERKPPVLIDTLLKLGYDFKVLSATKLTFPEFRKTAFVQIPQFIEDDYPAKDGPGRDSVMAEKFINFVSERNSRSRPFFSFMFFNASHQPYQYPPGFERFKPVARDINYIKGISRAGISGLKNRYMNALYFDDSLFGRIFDALNRKGLMKNTILVITGDHGEEFYEQGYFGHTSSFDDYETRTAFVMHMPGDKYKGMAVTRLTSHLDVVPTILTALGYTNDPEDYSQGIPLFAPHKRHSYVFSAGWDRLCMIDNDVKVVFGTETYRTIFDVLASSTYKPVKNPGIFLGQKKAEMSDVLKKMSEFYR
ncbi:MAG: sulfatase-like hydrolase/transferase [Nitrospiraceae bacterium]|nr:sulfatase-like hydrolase/transferase [Nitrospiraceae bacterium]